jgi:hypothetical protein
MVRTQPARLPGGPRDEATRGLMAVVKSWSSVET